MISSKSNYNPTIGAKKGVSCSRKETPFFEVSSCVMLYYFCNCWVISVLSFPLIPSASSAWSNVHFMLFMRF